jgi:hypothetical protein
MHWLASFAHVMSVFDEQTPPVTVQFGSVLQVQLAPAPLPVQLWCAPQTVQAEPHALPLFGTHEPPQRFVPLGHWQMLLTQWVPPVHGLLQPPQLASSLVSSTQPVLHLE